MIAIETNCAAVTVNNVEPVTPPDVALMFAAPCCTLVAKPVLAMVAIDCVSELQVAVDVRSCVVPSVNDPVAVNCCVVPRAIDGFAGVTAMDTSAAALTVKTVLPLTEPEVAVIVAAPVLTLVASPICLAALLMVATVGVSLDHATV